VAPRGEYKPTLEEFCEWLSETFRDEPRDSAPGSWRGTASGSSERNRPGPDSPLGDANHFGGSLVSPHEVDVLPDPDECTVEAMIVRA
jgi:hypothetical protein